MAFRRCLTARAPICWASLTRPCSRRLIARRGERTTRPLPSPIGWSCSALPSTAAVVLDPACGGGAFLLAAGRALVSGGASPAEAVRGLYGVDLDPLAVDVARAATAPLVRRHARGRRRGRLPRSGL